MKHNQDMLATMRIATRVLRSKGPSAATLVIQRALQKMLPLAGRLPGQRKSNFKEKPPPLRDIHSPSKIAPPQTAPPFADQQKQAYTGFFPKLFGGLSIPSPFDENWGQIGAPPESPASQDAPLGDPDDIGHFVNGSYTNHAGTRSYKLFIPSEYHGHPLPLVVMLHGCTQNPDDFAVGTGMNRIAEEQPCFVVYPAQSQAANSSRCWNWFNAADQQRDQGEPSIIAGITREIIDQYAIDRR